MLKSFLNTSTFIWRIRVKTAQRYVDEYFRRERYNPKLCLTEEEVKVVSKALPSPFGLRKGNLVNNEHLYMWKIKSF